MMRGTLIVLGGIAVLTNIRAAELLGPSGVSFPVGPSPNDVISADFDGDGAPDLAISDSVGSTVSILLGDGSRGFSRAPDVAVGASPEALAAADLDGDGALDLITANGGDDSVSVARGLGGGRFDPASKISGVGRGPVDLAVADLDADGDQDLVVVARYGNSLNILFGDGAGGFGAPVVIGGLGPDPFSTAVADLNRDGALDLSVTNLGGASVSVLLGDGRGGFSAPIETAVGPSPVSVVAADFDRDGVPDLTVINAGDGSTVGSMSVLLGMGDGTFVRQSPDIALGLTPFAAVVGDLDDDGASDVIATNFESQTVSVLLGDGRGGFTRRCLSTQGGECSETPAFSPRSVDLGDFDRDGAPDLVVANQARHSVTILFGDGLGGLAGAPENSVGRAPQAVVARDFNGDGRADLAVANTVDESVTVLLGDGIGGFVPGPDVGEVFEAPVALAADDFDHDGDVDLAVANFDAMVAHVSVLLGNGAGAFVRGQDITLQRDLPGALTADDFDGDGNLDLLVVHATRFLLQGNRASVLLGRGDGTFEVHTTLSIRDDAGVAAAGDLDGDGDLDFALTNFASQTVRIFLGQGNGDFVRLTPDIALGDAPTSIAARDLDGDGHLDLAIPLFNAGALARLRGVGDGSFVRMTPDVEVGDGPADIVVGDFNADLLPDLVICQSESHSIGLLLGSGGGGFVRTADLTTGAEPRIAVVADFDNDGAPDLAVANRSDDSVVTLFNQLAGRADLNGSNRVDGFDVARIGRLMGLRSDQPGYRRSADIDLDGTIDGVDLSLVAVRFGRLNRSASPLRATLVDPPPSSPDTVTLQSSAAEGDLLTVRVLVDDRDDAASASDFAATFGPDDGIPAQVLDLVGYRAGSYFAGGVAQFIGVNAKTSGRVEISALRFPPRDFVGPGPLPLLDLVFRARRTGVARLAFAPFRRSAPTLLYVDGCPDPNGCEVQGVHFETAGITVRVDDSAGGPPGRKIGVSPAPLGFGQARVGSVSRRTLRLSNFGFSELRVSAVRSTLPEFTTVLGCGTVVAPQSCAAVTIPAFGFVELPVEFAPTGVGHFSAELKIDSDDPNRPVVTVPISGSASE